MTMNTGKLNRRITIVTAGTLTPDGIGGFIEGSPTERETWCNAKQLSMSEQLLYGLQTSFASYQFMFLYYAADDVKNINRLTFEGRAFNIVRVDNVDEAKHTITVIANEQR